MSDKVKFPLAQAKAVAERLVKDLEPYCERIQIAGSIRRGKPEVGDIEILYVPKLAMRERVEGGVLFMDEGENGYEEISLVDEELTEMITEGFIRKRLNAKGSESWGEKIKLAVARASGIPVDFFATTQESWWNYLVCRTGPAESNMNICKRAIEAGLKWEPYSPGFLNVAEGRTIPMRSEKEVFATVGLPCPEFQR